MRRLVLRTLLGAASLVLAHFFAGWAAPSLLSFKYREAPPAGDAAARLNKAGTGPGGLLDWFPPGAAQPEYKILQDLLSVPGCSGVVVRKDSDLAGKYAAVAIGDSYTFGAGVRPEQAWPSLVEKKTGIRLLNFGIPGSNLQRKVELYENCVRRHSPSMVVLQLLADDVFDLETLNRVQWPRYVRYGRLANSFRNMADQYPPLYWSYSLRQLVGFPASEFLLLRTAETYSFLAGYELLTAFLDWAGIPPGASEAFQKLAQIRSRDMQTRLVVLVLPYKEELWWEDVVKLDIRAARFKPSRFREWVREQCDSLRLDCYDATENLREKKLEKIYFDVDDHPSPHGHVAIAEWVQSILNK